MKKIITALLITLCITGLIFEKAYDGNVKCMDVYLPTYENLDEFDDYVEMHKRYGYFSDSFINYHSIKKVGEFKSYVSFKTENYNNKTFDAFDTYTYSVKQNDTEFRVEISNSHKETSTWQEYEKKAKDYTKKCKPEFADDMRYFGKEITGTYTYKNVLRYYYYKGKLEYVYWILDNKTYVRVSTDKYYIYPLYTDTFQSKLLNLDTAIQAVTEVFGEPTPIQAFFEE